MFSVKRLPPPATASMVAGGGDLIILLYVFQIGTILEIISVMPFFPIIHYLPIKCYQVIFWILLGRGSTLVVTHLPFLFPGEFSHTVVIMFVVARLARV